MKNIFSRIHLVQKYFNLDAQKASVDVQKPQSEVERLFTEYNEATTPREKQAILDQIAMKNKEQTDKLLWDIAYAAESANEKDRADLLEFRNAVSDAYIQRESERKAAGDELSANV